MSAAAGQRDVAASALDPRALARDAYAHRVAVLGDFMLDAYASGSVGRVCPDAPAAVLELEDELLSAGGAGNVATGCTAFGLEVVACGFTGRDSAARALETLLVDSGVGLDGLVAVEGRTTLVKRRYCVGEQVLLRVDEGSTGPVGAIEARRLLRTLSRTDAVLVSDYGYGSVTDEVLSMLLDVRSAMGTKILVDAKRAERYRALHPDVVKPNYRQMCGLLGEEPDEDRRTHVERCAERLLLATGAKAVVVTLDGDGSAVVRPSGVVHVPAPRRVVRSTSGAGDTFLASLAAGMLAGEGLERAARYATWSATVACDGTGTVTAAHVRDAGRDRAKRLEPAEIARWGEEMRQAGRRVVLTNGCFDIFHAGHAHFLHRAAEQGDALMVAVNTDDRVRLLKGEDRPVNTLEDRLRVLEAVDVVSAVTWFDEQTAIEIVRRLRPDVYVKGADYRGESFPEERYVREYGGSVVFVDLLAGRSTTGIVQRVAGHREVPV